MSVFDGLYNLAARLGTDRDKASHTAYSFTPLQHHELLTAYRTAWLPRKIVDIPALDATRKWRAWQADKDQIARIEAEEKRLGLSGKVLDWITAGRLLRASAIYIGTGDADPAMPLNLRSIRAGGLRHLTVLTPMQISPGERDDDPESVGFGFPAYYRLTSSTRGEVRIHPSRLAVFRSSPLPSDATTYGDGWASDSVLQAVMDAVKHADSTAANIASLVFEAKIDVLKVQGLMDNMTDPAFESLMFKRLAAIGMMKGNNGSFMIDTQDDYQQKTASFATLPEVLDRFMQNVAGAADIPMTRLFGQSPAGLNATGDSDIRNYYDRVQSMQELEVSPAMANLDEALIRSALGDRPEEIHYNWRSLWQTTEKERAEIAKITAETAKSLKDAGIFQDIVLAEATSNALIEGGLLPGLEAAIDEHGIELEDPDEVEAGVMPVPQQPMPEIVEE